MAIGILSTVLGIGSAIFGAIGQRKQGQAAAQAGQYQAQVARRNAKIAIEYGDYDAAVARNNAISARYNAETALTIGDYNAAQVTTLGRMSVQRISSLGELSAETTTVLGEYNAFVAEQRGEQSKQRAEIAIQRAASKRVQQQQTLEEAQFQVEERRIETRQLVGSQRAQLAANGVIVDQGSAAGIVSSTYELGRRDQIRILTDADIDIFDLETQAYNFEAEAFLLNREAANYKVEASAKRYESSAEAARIRLDTAGRYLLYDMKRRGRYLLYDMKRRCGHMILNVKRVTSIIKRCLLSIMLGLGEPGLRVMLG